MLAEFIAHRDKVDEGTYRPSFRFDGPWLDERHESMPEVVRDVPGWLRDEDVLKLYELGRVRPGPVLEIGSYRGKSAVVLASAMRAAGGHGRLISVDIDPDALADARRAIRDRGLADLVVFARGSVTGLLRAAPALRPDVVFLDGDHSLAGVRRDLEALKPVVPDGALLLFHDYLDARNEDPEAEDIEVVRGVLESWVARDCEFAGAFGCCGLYRRLRGGSTQGPNLDERLLAGPGRVGGLPPLLDVVNRDTLRMRYLQRVRRPLGRFARRRLGPGRR